MTDISFSEAQADMRRAYLSGAPGVFVSGCVWLVAGLVAHVHAASAAVFVLLVGGALIHPLSIVLCRSLGRSGGHQTGNPLAQLAVEGTFWLLASIAVAYGMQVLRLDWFFPAMLLVIGGRYLTFQSLYGLRVYWVCGAVLCAAGVALALGRAPAQISALTGAAIEIALAAAVFWQARGVTAAQLADPSGHP